MGILRNTDRTFRLYRPPTEQEKYEYGAPTSDGGDGSSTDVTLQYLFDEGSGNIVDEVSAVTLTATGSPAYSQAATGLWANMTPGCKTKDGGFIKASATSEADPGTGDFVWEWACEAHAIAGTSMVCEGDRLNNKGWQLYWSAATTLNWYLKADDATTVSSAWTGV
ncbi:MAG: hypothetical protein ACW99U_17930, partial [Candidatus Thorarchaeota archaeon]